MLTLIVVAVATHPTHLLPCAFQLPPFALRPQCAEPCSERSAEVRSKVSCAKDAAAMAEQAPWTVGSVDAQDFYLNVNLLRVLGKGNLKPEGDHDVLDGAASSDEEEDDCSDDGLSDGLSDTDNEGSDISGRNDLVSSNNDKLKCRFLDRLAEFASAQKGAFYVTSAAMVEREGQVELWLARNTQYAAQADEEQQTLTNIVCTLLPRECTDVSASDGELWQQMIAFYRLRLEQYYIPDFRTAYSNTRPDYDRNTLSGAELHLLQEVDCLFESCPKAAVQDDALLNKIVCIAYGIRVSSDAKRFLRSNQTTLQSPKTSLWKATSFLGRLRAAFETFCDVAKRLESFQRVSLRFVHGYSPPHRVPPAIPSNAIGAAITRQRRRCGNSQAAWCRMRDFEIFKNVRAGLKKRLHIHSEIQLIHATATEQNVFPYLGGSKLCCQLCHTFLGFYGAFGTRGSHSGIYHQWTLPSMLTEKRAKKVVNAMYKTLEHVKQTLDDPMLGKQRATAQSSDGKTPTDYVTFYDSSNDAEILPPRQRWDFDASNRRQREQASFENFVQYGQPTTGPCLICETMTDRRCSICDQDWFCDPICERTYTRKHPSQCLNTELVRHSTLRCCVCGAEEAHKCRTCQSAAWCSAECYADDKRLHDMLCNKWTLSSYARPRQSAQYASAFYFGVDSAVPQMTWFEIGRQYDEDTRCHWASANVTQLLGEDNPSESTRIIQHSYRVGFPLHRTIGITFRDAFLIDGSKNNSCIMEATNGSVTHTWKGPVVALRWPGLQYDPVRFEDVQMEDLRFAVDYLGGYGEEHVEDIGSGVVARPGKKVPVVRVNCEGDRRLFGCVFEPKHVQESGLEVHMSKSIPITKLLGLPLLYHVLGGDQDLDPNADIPENPEFTCMMIDIDNRSETWGFRDFRRNVLGMGTDSAVIFREDHAELSPGIVEDVYRFCETVLPAFHQASEQGSTQMGKARVMSLITPEHFADFRETGRIKGLNHDVSQALYERDDFVHRPRWLLPREDKPNVQLLEN